MSRLVLQRPLVVFDLETTGTDPARDRIVEVSAMRLDVDGGREVRTRRINPGRPIPPAATAIHHITDDDVRDAPSFKKIARGLLEFLADADLAGFNILRFDLPLLDREFRDAGLDLEAAGRRLIDCMTIYHRKEPRHLSAAVRFYLDREHAGAHSAEEDVTATAEILDAQLERYDDLPADVGELDAWLRPGRGDAVDTGGKLVWRDGEAVFSFGKHRGESLRAVKESHAGYLDWILTSDFPADLKAIVESARQGAYPEPRDG